MPQLGTVSMIEKRDAIKKTGIWKNQGFGKRDTIKKNRDLEKSRVTMREFCVSREENSIVDGSGINSDK
jgi:hypothetical protein